jgi:uncharacterized protein involved in exopolysaccharide biosynthesis
VNRRLLTFSIVFLAACIGGLAYTFSITPTYVGHASLQVDPGSSPEQSADTAAFVGNEAQVLMSNEMLAALLTKLRERSSAGVAPESVARLRDMLSAAPIEGTNTIQLEARGSRREQLAHLLDSWTATYLESRGTRRVVDRDIDLVEARRAVDSIESRVTRRRNELDAFRRQHSIVSPEREENEIASQMRSLMAALNDARNKATDAESRMAAVKASMAAGTPVYRAQDKAQITALEQRIVDLRQKLSELELRFTPDYLAIEPGVKTMRANIRQLEQEIERTRRTSQQAMLDEASQDLTLARKNVARLEEQVASRRTDALKFTSQFGEHKARVDELARLEGELNRAKEKLAGLERTERGREPKYEVLGRAAVSEAAEHPNYAAYIGGSIGGGLLAGLLAVLLVEFLSPRPRREAPAYPQPIIQIAYPALEGGGRSETLRLAHAQQALPGSSSRFPALSEQAALRELTIGEVNALWSAATQDGKLALAALFSGLTLDELAALEWNDIDIEAGQVRVRSSQRTHALTSPLAEELRSRLTQRERDTAVATSVSGARFSVRDLEGLIAAAAYDARLAQAETIDADSLRHTYISFLVRQGVRLSDLERFVGTVAPALYLHYRNLSPAGPAASDSEPARVYPAFAAA